MFELSQLAVCLLFVLCTIKDVHIYICTRHFRYYQIYEPINKLPTD